MAGELVLDLLSCNKDHSMLCVKYFLRDLEALEKENQVQAGRIRPLKEGRALANWAIIWPFSRGHCEAAWASQNWTLWDEIARRWNWKWHHICKQTEIGSHRKGISLCVWETLRLGVVPDHSHK